MKKPIIEFNNFSFRYEAQVENTLKNINLKVYPNEKILILGPSGSGKSTLSYCINGLIPHSFYGEISGSCLIHGEDSRLTSIFKLSKKVGTVLQDSDLQFVGLTVGEDIAFSMENQNIPRDEMLPRVFKSAELVGMEAFLGQIPFELSGGQKQKVSIAGVLNEAVDILLFDEPLASLDPQMGRSAIELIDQLKDKTNATIVIIEHRLEDVLHAPVDRIILMNDGEIVADTTPNDLLATNLLQTYGIREPLYLSAIKNIAGELVSNENLDNLSKLDLSPYENELHKYFNHPLKRHKEERSEQILFDVNNVSFGYEEKYTLNDITFKVTKGERIALIGENGAGKSTLAKLLVGAYHPQQGSINFLGNNTLQLSVRELAQTIGYVMQNPNQMLVKDIVTKEVRLALELRQVPNDEIDKLVEETLKITGLYPMRNWPIDSLSYGQKKRVTIASILVLRPDCLILDEPTAGQDFYHYREVMSFVDTLNREMGLTLIFITHDMHLAMEYTDRALVLSQGKLLADDQTTSVLSNPELLKEASLKETSLSQLARRIHVDSTVLIEQFVRQEKERNHG